MLDSFQEIEWTSNLMVYLLLELLMNFTQKLVDKEYLKVYNNEKIQLKPEVVQTRRVFLYGTQFISRDMTLKLTGLRQKMSVSNAVC